MKAILLFSGQGAQKAGMGLDFMNDPVFKETIGQASVASKKNIEEIFVSKNNELKKTVNVQPALVAFEIGIYRMLRRDLPKLQIQGMIGLSLGEYGAMCASGALNLEDTINLVSARARYMQEDTDQVQSGMVALVKPKISKVEEIIKNLQQVGEQVFIANYNSPLQIVISGEKEAVKEAAEIIKEKKAALKIVTLDVNGAFHTPLFKSTSQKMRRRLQTVTFSKSEVPVISNTTGVVFDNNWDEVMAKQVMKPTYFGKGLAYLLKQKDADAVIEIGPGKTLSMFAKQVNRKLSRYQLGQFKKYQEFIEEQNGLKG